MSDRGGGRARGRSRARSQSQPEAVRRPGDTAPTPRLPPQQPPLQQPQAAPQPPVGRVSRGLTHEEQATVRPGVSTVSKVLESLHLGDNGARGGGRGAWRGRDTPDPVTRPAHVTDKRGSAGTRTALVANYFKVNSVPKWAIYHYHVDFSPDQESIRVKRAMMNAHRELLGVHMFDGGSLYKMERFDQDEQILTSTKRSDGTPVNMRIKLVRELPPTDNVVLQILGIQIRKAMHHLNFSQIQEYYYDQNAGKQIENHNLEVWPGFATAIHQHENATMLCADLVFKILRQESVLDQLNMFASRNPRDYRSDAERELIGCIVMTRYNNRPYKLDDLAWDRKPTDTFMMKDGTNITFIDYYKEHWNIDLLDHRQPMLVSMPKKRDINRGQTTPFLLAPEVCIMTGISNATRASFTIMKDIATHTRVGPDGRVARLTHFMNRMLSDRRIVDDMNGWGLSYSANLAELEGRTLPPEKIIQGQGRVFSYDQQSADWTREMRSNQLINSVAIQHWAMLVIRRDITNAREFEDTLQRVCPPMGIRLGRSQLVNVNSERVYDYMQALESVSMRELQLVVVIVPNDGKDRYDAIKKHCCIDHPVASQVVLSRTISKRQMLMSVSTKIAIQLNCKLGGSAWTLEIPLSRLMVIGYDSYHDSSKKGLSVGALCCSFNKSLTRYYSQVKFQVSSQEMADGLKMNIVGAIRHYKKENDELPETVVIYRDGIGVGDLANIKDEELKQVNDGFKEIGLNFQPRLVFIVVNKRICTRLFEKQGNQVRNPTPGTVVDTVITRPEFYDFFLISQAVRQGTVTPTQYNIIENTSHLQPDHIQRLTYKLTHLYYNWPGTIRVPAPCLYAHKLAFLTGQSLHTNPNPKLADTLFFL